MKAYRLKELISKLDGVSSLREQTIAYIKANPAEMQELCKGEAFSSIANLASKLPEPSIICPCMRLCSLSSIRSTPFSAL